MDESRRYESLKQLVSVTGFVLDILILLFLLTSHATIRFGELSEGFSGARWLSVVIYVLVLGGILKAVDLPLTFVWGYVLERRLGLSRQSLGGWINDQLKGIAI